MVSKRDALAAAVALPHRRPSAALCCTHRCRCRTSAPCFCFLFLQDAQDLTYEEFILRDPYSLSHWLTYLEFKGADCAPAARWIIFERAVRMLPGSYKLWIKYLRERVVSARRVTDGQRTNDTRGTVLALWNSGPRGSLCVICPLLTALRFLLLLIVYASLQIFRPRRGYFRCRLRCSRR